MPIEKMPKIEKTKRGFKKQVQMLILALSMLAPSSKAIAEEVKDFVNQKEKVRNELKAEENEALRKIKEQRAGIEKQLNTYCFVDKKGDDVIKVYFENSDKDAKKPIAFAVDTIVQEDGKEKRFMQIDSDADGDVDRTLLATYGDDKSAIENDAAKASDEMKMFQGLEGLKKELGFADGTDMSKLFVLNGSIEVLDFSSGKVSESTSQSTILNANQSFKQSLGDFNK